MPAAVARASAAAEPSAAAAEVVAPTGPTVQTGTLQRTQLQAAPEGLDCLQARLHAGSFPQCNGIDLVRTVTVNGVDVAAGTKLALGDVVRVSVWCPARGDWDAYYKETGDGLYATRTRRSGSGSPSPPRRAPSSRRPPPSP